MLYPKKNNNSELVQIFKNPTSEYRGIPFWAWNNKLNKDQLIEQIEYLKEMGFGGVQIHARNGLAVDYLGEEYFELYDICVKKCEEEGLYLWIYDEDRWPSGVAGGFVTKNREYSQRYIFFTTKQESCVSKSEGIKEGKTYLLSTYDVVLDEDGKLSSYSKIEENAIPKGRKWFAYIKSAQCEGRFNNQPYVDLMNTEAIDSFIDITYESYKANLGDKFGKSIPAVFTDEPQFRRKTMLGFSKSETDVEMPWTPDFDETFYAKYKIDIIESLPEIIWELPNNQLSQVRYFYHDHTAERLVASFIDKCGDWCGKNNLIFTGHMMEEPTLESQTAAIGEAMRAYRSFGMPGIDMLCNWTEFTTAKQAQSAVHQYGYEGIVSELYGVTNWDFDFRGHKFQGDWQAALGVTLRVPHLSWVSMKGSSKRDYPASINYQSPWWREYKYVEDHFARLASILTRGNALANIAVIHPIESYWLNWGPLDYTSAKRKQLDEQFKNITEWLLFDLLDFDYISESLLPDLCGDISSKLNVGKMKYDTIIIPACKTLRKTTCDILGKFCRNGGKVIVLGEYPEYMDGKLSEIPTQALSLAEKIEFNKISLSELLDSNRMVDIRNSNGTRTDNLIYSLRENADKKWLFIAHGKQNSNFDVSRPQNINIIVKGSFKPTLYNTLNGDIEKLEYKISKGYTDIQQTLYANDSLLICLEETDSQSFLKGEKDKSALNNTIIFKDQVEYTLTEQNVCLLDIATSEYEGNSFVKEEILKIDQNIRRMLNFPLFNQGVPQPWAVPADTENYMIDLAMDFTSEISVEACLAVETANKVVFNGEEVEVKFDGWFVDKDIRKINLPKLRIGKNSLVVTVPLSKRTSLEPMYILGDFNVVLNGSEKLITSRKEKIGFGSIHTQGLPFYGGNIIYKTSVELPDCDISIKTNHYRGAAIKVYFDDEFVDLIAFDPYTVNIKNVKSGTHTIKFELLGNRHNTFGSLHNISGDNWYGPWHWYASGDAFSYEYQLRDTGILSSPVIQIFSK